MSRPLRLELSGGLYHEAGNGVRLGMLHKYRNVPSLTPSFIAVVPQTELTPSTFSGVVDPAR